MTENKILIIDDEVLVRETIEACFEVDERDYRLFFAENGEVGLNRFYEHEPDLVILDLKMPVMNGIEFLRRINISPDSSCSVIALTGHGDNEEVEECFNLGVSAFLRKPFNFYELNGLVRYSLRVKENEKALKERTRELQEANDRLNEYLREKEVLIREVNHRVKNNLAVISSLLYLQANCIHDQRYRDIFVDNYNRIHSIARIHEELYQSNDLAGIDFRNTIHTLIRDLVEIYNVDRDLIDFTLELDDIALSINNAIPCALILNELVSNALKYAFPKGRKGNIRIVFKLSGQVYTLMVSDNGVGLPGEVSLYDKKYLGLQLVNNLVIQLHGTLNLDPGEGTSFKILFDR